MEARAIAKYIRISPLKVNRVAGLVRGKDVADAMNILTLTGNKPAGLIKDVIKSAAANAENNHDMDAEKLYVAEVYANQGPTLKRFKAGSQGRASQILKRTSHIGVVLKEKAEKGENN